jgi:hypothetical protein
VWSGGFTVYVSVVVLEVIPALKPFRVFVKNYSLSFTEMLQVKKGGRASGPV